MCLRKQENDGLKFLKSKDFSYFKKSYLTLVKFPLQKYMHIWNVQKPK